MCTTEYLDKRHADVVDLIAHTVFLAVRGTTSDCGACMPGQVSEIKVMLEVLRVQSLLLALIIARRDKVTLDEGEVIAMSVVHDLLGDEVKDEGRPLKMSFNPSMN